jgi:hypothetical protein
MIVILFKLYIVLRKKHTEAAVEEEHTIIYKR